MKKIGNMLKHLVPKFRPDLSPRLKTTTEKQVPAKLKPIVAQGSVRSWSGEHQVGIEYMDEWQRVARQTDNMR